MIFLATPHQGSDWPKLMEDVFRVNLPIYIKDFKRGSEFLVKLNQNFRNQAHHLQLTSFRESRETSAYSKRGSPKAIVVDPSSAKIGKCICERLSGFRLRNIDLPHEKIMPLDADHRQICKFSSNQDENYQHVRNAIVATFKRILENGMGRLYGGQT